MAFELVNDTFFTFLLALWIFWVYYRRAMRDHWSISYWEGLYTHKPLRHTYTKTWSMNMLSSHYDRMVLGQPKPWYMLFTKQFVEDFSDTN